MWHWVRQMHPTPHWVREMHPTPHWVRQMHPTPHWVRQMHPTPHWVRQMHPMWHWGVQREALLAGDARERLRVPLARDRVGRSGLLDRRDVLFGQLQLGRDDVLFQVLPPLCARDRHDVGSLGL